MIKIIRLTTPAIFSVPQIQAFFLQAARDAKYPNPEDVVDVLARESAMPGSQILIGFEDEVPVAVTVTMLPGSPLMLLPQVVMAYNKGTRAMTSGLMSEIKSFLQDWGWKKFLCVNLSDHDDKTYARAYRSLGELTKKNSIMEFEIKD